MSEVVPLPVNASTTNKLVKCLSVRRYQPNEQYLALIQRYADDFERDNSLYAYDIDILHESVGQTVLLHQKYHTLLETGELGSGTRIQVIRSSSFYNEAEAEPKLVVFIEELVILEDNEEIIIDDSIPMDLSDDINTDHLSDTPLMGKNKIYLHVDDEDVYTGSDLWKQRDLVLPEEERGSFRLDIATTLDLYERREGSKSFSLKKEAAKKLKKDHALPYLIGVVECKSRLSYSHSSKFPYPIQFWFYLRDGESTIKVVVWGMSCFRYFNAFSVGDVILVRNFRVKTSIFSSAHIQDPRFSNMEISVNPSNPQGEIFVLDSNVGTQRFFEMLESKTIEEIQREPDGTRNSVLGRVTCVGKVLRKRSHAKIDAVARAKSDIYRYRWMWLSDDSTHLELPVLVYSSIKRDFFDNLKLTVGRRVVVQEIEVRSQTVNSIIGRKVHAECTNETSIILSGADDESETGSEVVRRDHGYVYSPAYTRIEEVLEHTPSYEFVPISLISTVLGNLADRETTTVFIHAIVKDIVIRQDLYTDVVPPEAVDGEEAVEEQYPDMVGKEVVPSKEEGQGSNRRRSRRKIDEQTEKVVAETQTDELQEGAEGVEAVNRCIVLVMGDLSGEHTLDVIMFSKYNVQGNFSVTLSCMFPPMTFRPGIMFKLSKLRDLETLRDELKQLLIGGKFTTLVSLFRSKNKSFAQCLSCFALQETAKEVE